MDLLTKFFLAENDKMSLTHLFMSKSLSDIAFKKYCSERLEKYNVDLSIVRKRITPEIELNYTELYLLLEGILSLHKQIDEKWCQLELREDEILLYIEGINRDSDFSGSYLTMMKNIYLLPYIDKCNLFYKKNETESLNFKLEILLDTKKFVAYELDLEREETTILESVIDSEASYVAA